MRSGGREYPRGVVVMYVNTTAEVKALTDYCCTSANAVQVVRHIYDTHGPDTEILFGPDMWLGAYVEKELGKRMHVWDGECHVHAGIRPADIAATRAAHPGADFLIHPECGCTTSVMEFLAAGDIAAEGVHMLSTGGMLKYAEQAEHRAPGTAEGAGVERWVDGEGGPSTPNGGSTAGESPAGERREVVVATETGMLYPLQDGRARHRLHPRQRRGQLRVHEDDHAAQAARLPAGDEVRGAGAAGDRRARAHPDRPHGGDRLSPPWSERDDRQGRAPGCLRRAAPTQPRSLGGGPIQIRAQNSSALCGPTQATARFSVMPSATSRTSS